MRNLNKKSYEHDNTTTIQHRHAAQRAAHHTPRGTVASGVLRLRRKRWHTRRTARGRGHGTLLRTHDVQRHGQTTSAANPELPGARGRRPQCVHGEGGHSLPRRHITRPHGTRRRPADRHRVSQHIPTGRDRQRGGGDMRRDRELQRLAIGAGI